MSQSKWLISAVVPGIERQPLKKLDPDEEALRKLLHRWRNDADRAGSVIKRIAVVFEAGRDGLWLARWLQARDVEAYVIHPASVAVSREHWWAKTDRLDTELATCRRGFWNDSRPPIGYRIVGTGEGCEVRDRPWRTAVVNTDAHCQRNEESMLSNRQSKSLFVATGAALEGTKANERRA